MRIRWPAIVIILVCTSTLIYAQAASANQHKWGASYLNWSGALLDKTSTLSQVIQPLELSPNMYWEAGWNWDNAKEGGYGGIQSNGILADGRISDIAIFSIWNGLGAIPGESATCAPFGGEGIGYSCRIPISLKAGNKYEISFGVDQALGPQWWVANISDLAKGTKEVIGYIETNSKAAKATNWNNFIEYWGQEVSCNAVGRASAKFYVPTSNNPDVEISSPEFSRPPQPCVNSAADTPPPGEVGDAVMRFGGNSQEPSTQNMPQKSKTQIENEKLEIALILKNGVEKAAADLKAKQEVDAKAAADKAAADLKAKQEADAKAVADKAAADLKAKQDSEAKAAADKAAAELKAKQDADAKEVEVLVTNFKKRIQSTLSNLRVRLLAIKNLSTSDRKKSEQLQKDLKLVSTELTLISGIGPAISELDNRTAGLVDQVIALEARYKKTTITCIKGKTVKKITAVKPVCPKGYKVKK